MLTEISHQRASLREGGRPRSGGRSTARAFKSESFRIEDVFAARRLPQSLRDSSLPEGANANGDFPMTSREAQGQGIT